ncbi:MAG: hypothetical protein AAFY29_16825 [Pseudomonadota bacterium]
MTTLEVVARYFDLLFFIGGVVIVLSGVLGIRAFRRKRVLRGLSWLALGIPVAFLCLVVPKRAALAAVLNLGSDERVSIELSSRDDQYWVPIDTNVLLGARRYRPDFGSGPTNAGYRLRVCDRDVGDCVLFVLQRDSRGGDLYWLMLVGRKEKLIPLGFLLVNAAP